MQQSPSLSKMTDDVTRKRRPGFYTDKAKKRFKYDIIGTIIFKLNKGQISRLRDHNEDQCCVLPFRDSKGKDREATLELIDDGNRSMKMGIHLGISGSSRLILRSNGQTEQFKISDDGYFGCTYVKDEFFQHYIDDNGELTLSVDIEEGLKYPQRPPDIGLKYQPCLADVLKSTDTADVTFVVGGKQFLLHKCIIATHCPKL